MTGDTERDFIGYGVAPPHPRWPGGARLALNFVVNVEEGAERSILDGDEAAETILSDLAPASAPPGRRDPLIESLYEYGARVGIWRVLEAFRARAIIPTVYAAGLALERNPAVAEAIAAMGCDVVGHGWLWIDYCQLGEDEERTHMARTIATVTRLTGNRPLGWYAGRPGPNTRRLVVEEGGFLYDSDAYNDELPYWITLGGMSHLVIPHSLDLNDSRFARGQGLELGAHFFSYLKDAFDCLYAEGARTPRLMTVSLHPRLIGRPGRIAGLARFLDYARSRARVWICRREEIARHWQHEFSPGRAPVRGAVGVDSTKG